MTAPDILAIAARRICGLSPEWEPRIYRSLDSCGVELIGAKPIGEYTRGPKKGQPKFPPRKDLRSVFLPRDQISQTRQQWEQETGLCSHCGGSGQTIRIASIHGNTYKPCDRCKGTGRMQP
jgi:hypothetical protein